MAINIYAKILLISHNLHNNVHFMHLQINLNIYPAIMRYAYQATQKYNYDKKTTDNKVININPFNAINLLVVKK